MNNITVEQITNVLKYIVEIAGIIGTVYVLLMKGIKKLFEPLRDDIREEKKARLKSDLTTLMYLADNGTISDEQKMLANEEYDDYIEMGGNSYIKNKFEKLVKEGKI